VFPVPDKDTGNNLTQTFKGIYDAIERFPSNNIHQLKSHIIDGALASASGNVGIIITGFINGFLSPLPIDKIRTNDLKKGMKEGFQQAFEAIQNPKKGTILDVIQACADSFSSQKFTDNLIPTLMKTAHKHAQEALKKTQNQMDLYKKMSVVDAGAYGFVLILEGFLEGLHNTHITFKEHKTSFSDNKPTSIKTLSNRYEVISLLEYPHNNRREILTILAPLGDSIDIVEANDKMKIHIHTDYPEKVSKYISNFGDVLQMHRYDMTKGTDTYLIDEVSIGLVSDEGACLPLALSTKLDVIVVPFQTSWEKADADLAYSGKTVYEQMRLIQTNTDRYGWPKTSQPSQKAYLRSFIDQLKKFKQVLCITFSSQLSGAYNSAIQARKMLSETDQKRVCIPDLWQAGGGQGILVLEANRLIKMGISMDDIIKRLTSLVTEIKVLVFTADPSWIVEGGRVSKSKGKIMSLLKLFSVHPIFHLEKGKVGLKGFQWGKNIVSQRVYDVIRKIKKGKKTKIVINHADNITDVEKLKKLLPNISYEILYENILPPVLGVHTGPDSIIVSYY